METSVVREELGGLRGIRGPNREEALLRCRPTETWGFAGTTHRSPENDGLPLPGHAPLISEA